MPLYYKVLCHLLLYQKLHGHVNVVSFAANIGLDGDHYGCGQNTGGPSSHVICNIIK